ncbi:DUF6415 family natural product biosynthesis protein [Streptomyces sp. NBRC 110465]|uniref:DUF6415 family natural product biosynthesis protein n=1 Tax=Streptomyces sp. NBRC 110465 TaxID=1897621 RepID=UPI001F3F4542|nr:DUF6415 family natural product biosynthesis protein [Streptomyces sp. NBRC 110465]
MRHAALRTEQTTRRERDASAAAMETVALVLEDGSPLPETAEDVHHLVQRLRGHVMVLGGGLPASYAEDVLAEAHAAAEEETPEGFMPSRVYLVRLARATKALAEVQAESSQHLPARRTTGLAFRGWPSRNMLRAVTFAVAMATLILAASVRPS